MATVSSLDFIISSFTWMSRKKRLCSIHQYHPTSATTLPPFNLRTPNTPHLRSTAAPCAQTPKEDQEFVTSCSQPEAFHPFLSNPPHLGDAREDLPQRETPDNASEAAQVAGERSLLDRSTCQFDVLSRREIWARTCLVFVPILWGTYGPALRFIYEQENPPSPSVLTLACEALSVLIFFFFLPLENSLSRSDELQGDANDNVKYGGEKTADKVGYFRKNQLSGFLTNAVTIEWTAAFELGLWTFLGTALQTDGLHNTTAIRSGFLLQTITVLVPLLTAISGVQVRRCTWLATIVALLGVVLMNVPKSDGTLSDAFAPNLCSGEAETCVALSATFKGDLEVLLASLFYAFCTVRLGVYAAGIRPVRLTTNFMIVSTTLAASWVFSDMFKDGLSGVSFETMWNSNVMAAIVFSALVPGSLASLGQTLGQKVVPASEAQAAKLLFNFGLIWSLWYKSAIRNSAYAETFRATI